MKYYIIAILVFSAVASSSAQKAIQTQNTVEDYAATITSNELKEMLYIYAGDDMRGRMTGSKGQKLAVNYLKDFYIAQGIKSPLEDNNYFQKVTTAYWAGFIRLSSFKEYYNHKKGNETADLSGKYRYAIDYDSYYTEALDRYNKHKEKRDAIDKLKISSGLHGVGNKIGQENG